MYISGSSRRKRFQSTLPRGSDYADVSELGDYMISIHAPSRERLSLNTVLKSRPVFQSTLPRGSDLQKAGSQGEDFISIHAPSRERHYNHTAKASPA